MSYDVVVVGGGIGGLTAAALFSARGFSTCLLERQSQVGGCIGRVEFAGFDFEPGMGLYSSFGPGEIFQTIFSELPVRSPAANIIEGDYVVRLEDKRDVRLSKDDIEFSGELRAAFPECGDAAIEFYELIKQVNSTWAGRSESQRSSGLFEKAFQRFRSKSHINQRLEELKKRSVGELLGATSSRFKSFIDSQLNAFLHTGIDQCAFIPACLLLSLVRGPLYSIDGGATSLAEHLADSIKQSGGVVRFNSPVLRLAYNESGEAIGVDLLSGERVLAKQAIISNLTIWDTYGKLVGLNRTPSQIKSRLAQLLSKGAYVLYAAIEDATLQNLPGRNLLVIGEDLHQEENLSSEFALSIGHVRHNNKWPATIKAATEVAPWFSFQTSEEDYVERDQTTLEQLWARLHKSLPELGSGIEVIETSNPRVCYDQSRRKLGMVMGTPTTVDSWAIWSMEDAFKTTIPNLFVVGDTVSPTFGIAGAATTAYHLAQLFKK